MTEPKRFRLGYFDDEHCKLYGHPEGEFVTYDDYDALRACAASEATKSDGGVEGHAIPRTTSATTTRYPETEGERNMVATARRTEEYSSTETGQAGVEPGPSEPSPQDAIQRAFEVAWAKRPWVSDESDKDRAFRWWNASAVSLSAPVAPGPSDPSSTGSDVTVDELARFLDPLAFDDDPVVRHRYCSPLSIKVVQDRARDKARALLDTYKIGAR